MDNSSSALVTLNTTRLFVDAEISYVDMPIDASLLDRFPIYDVYNNGHHIGGRLNVTLDRYFVYSQTSLKGYLTESIVNINTKYDNRMDLSDVTMRVGTVVRLILNNCQYIKNNVFIFP